MLKELFFSSVLLMSGCAPSALAIEKPVTKGPDLPEITLITPEGYILFLTSDLSMVRRLCTAITGDEIPASAVIFGCSKWNYEEHVKDKHDPKGPCLAVAMFGRAPDGEMVYEHELRHCREGYFHG